MPIIECVTGQIFSRSLNTTPVYNTKSAINSMIYFAPRLKADLEQYMNKDFGSIVSCSRQTCKLEFLVQLALQSWKHKDPTTYHYDFLFSIEIATNG